MLVSLINDLILQHDVYTQKVRPSMMHPVPQSLALNPPFVIIDEKWLDLPGISAWLFVTSKCTNHFVVLVIIVNSANFLFNSFSGDTLLCKKMPVLFIQISFMNQKLQQAENLVSLFFCNFLRNKGLLSFVMQ